MKFGNPLNRSLTKDEHGLYYIDWLENSINERKGYSETNSINGKLGGRPPKEFYVFKRKIEESLHEATLRLKLNFAKRIKNKPLPWKMKNWKNIIAGV
jgi:hypothetical protein